VPVSLDKLYFKLHAVARKGYEDARTGARMSGVEEYGEEYEVVIVGAGAAGLAAAAALGDHGIATLLVEERTEPPTLPRATVISTRSMELLRAWGLEEDTLAGGVD